MATYLYIYIIQRLLMRIYFLLKVILKTSFYITASSFLSNKSKVYLPLVISDVVFEKNEHNDVSPYHTTHEKPPVNSTVSTCKGIGYSTSNVYDSCRIFKNNCRLPNTNMLNYVLPFNDMNFPFFTK